MLAADLFETIYESEDCGTWTDACDTIIELAEQFEKELDWKEDEDRDYLDELQKFEDRILKERGLKK